MMNNNVVKLNDEMMAQVNGGYFFPNTYKDDIYKSVGIVLIRTHFWDPDEFVLSDGRIIDMKAANQLVEDKYGDKLGKKHGGSLIH